MKIERNERNEEERWKKGTNRRRRGGKRLCKDGTKVRQKLINGLQQKQGKDKRKLFFNCSILNMKLYRWKKITEKLRNENVEWR
jgi:hypothetical protein